MWTQLSSNLLPSLPSEPHYASQIDAATIICTNSTYRLSLRLGYVRPALCAEGMHAISLALSADKGPCRLRKAS